MGIMKYFKNSLILTAVGLGLAYFIGGMQAMFIVAVLGVLEVSLSFDNAVVNASVLNDMTPEWQHRFITWGMVIAVFGMRILFPLLIVAVVAHIGPVEVVKMAIYNPAAYAQHLTAAHVAVSGFGGAFLMMVGLKYFFDQEKDTHWVSFIEKPLNTLGKLEGAEIAVTLIAMYITSRFLGAQGTELMVASVFGIITYIVVDGVGAFMESTEESMVGTAVKSGLAMFLYLEVLDASFSFDGVIGAFAISNSIFIIAIGLGIGAMFVRSLTLMLVDKGTLSEFKYLEHGAFYAICSLAVIMFLKTKMEIPEVVTGFIGAGFILSALASSIIYNKNHPEEAEADGENVADGAQAETSDATKKDTIKMVVSK